MSRPKSGIEGGRKLRPRITTTTTNAGVSKTPKGRVGDKANESGDRVEGQESTAGGSQPDQPSTADIDMAEAPPIDDPTESASDSPAEPNSPSTESTPAQSDSSPNASTPASDHKQLGSYDPDEVVLLQQIPSPSVRYITKGIDNMRVEQEDEHLLAIVSVSGNKWKILGFGPHDLRDYGMVSWKSWKALKTYTLTEDERKLELNPISLKDRTKRGEKMKAFGGVAMRGDIGLLIPTEGEPWPPPNIRILVKWKKDGKDVVATSWETYGFIKKAWDRKEAPYLEPGKAALKSLRESGRICKYDKAVTILKDIPVGRRILKKGRKLTTFDYAVIDAAVRCRQRYDEGLISKDKGNIAKRYATPAFTSDGNGDSAHIKSGGTRFIASKEALDTAVKQEK